MAFQDSQSTGGGPDRGARTRRGEQSLLGALWRGKATIVGAILLAAVAGLLYLAVTPPRYLASTSILIDPRLGRGVGSDPNQPGFTSDASAVDSQVKLLTSQTVLKRVGKAANLVDDPEFNGSQRSLLARLTQAAQPPGVDLKALEDAITIKRPERTYVIEIQVLARNADKAADIANAVVQAYIEDQVQARVEAAESDGRFVRDRLADLQAQIRIAETKVAAYKTTNNIVTASGLRSNEQQVLDLTRSLGEARARASDAKARQDEIKLLASQGQLAASGEALKSMTIERLRSQQAEVARDVAKLSRTLGERHPALQEARKQQQEIAQLITEELKRLETGAHADYQIASRNEAQIVAEVDTLKGQSNALSTTLVPLAQLEREVDALRGSYDRFAKIKDSLSEQEADSPPARVIAVARAPVSPSVPKRSIVALVALAGGLFLGIAAALAREGARATRTGPPGDPPRQDRPGDRPAPGPRGLSGAPPVQRRPARYWDDRLDDVRP